MWMAFTRPGRTGILPVIILSVASCDGVQATLGRTDPPPEPVVTSRHGILRLCLAALPGEGIDSIERVYSHIQALTQAGGPDVGEIDHT